MTSTEQKAALKALSPILKEFFDYLTKVDKDCSDKETDRIIKETFGPTALKERQQLKTLKAKVDVLAKKCDAREYYANSVYRTGVEAVHETIDTPVITISCGYFCKGQAAHNALLHVKHAVEKHFRFLSDEASLRVKDVVDEISALIKKYTK